MSRPLALLSRSLSALLLTAYPRQLRDAYGGEIRDTFVARVAGARRHGPLDTLLLLGREVGDSVRTGLCERLRRADRTRLRSTLPPRRPRSPSDRLRRLMDRLLQDTRFAVRTLVKNPGFAIVSMLVLALGIGANTAIFSLVSGVLLDPMPFAEPDRLIAIWETNPERGWTHAQVAAANYLDWAEQSRTVPEMAAHADWLEDFAFSGDGAPITLSGNRVTGNFFSVLGVTAAVGTTFRPEDTWAGDEPAVVLSHALWRNRFESDPGIVGNAVTLDDVAHRVIGVAPAGFEFPFAGVDLWVPFGWAPEQRATISFRRAHGYGTVGRLAPEADLDAAIAELKAIAARLEIEYPETNTQMGVGAGPLHAEVVGETTTPLLVLLSAVGMVLLIACANVANMQLTRSAAREREMSVRAALGAGRGRLLRQGFTESLLLALVGGGSGLLLGIVGTRAIVALSPADIPRLANVQVDLRVVLFALAVTLATTVLFGFAPAWKTARVDLRAGLTGGARTAGGRRSGRFAGALVAAEIALALPLAIGTGLMVRTLAELRGVDLGFRPQGAVAVQVSLPASRYPDHASAMGLYRGIVDRARALPGVEAAGLSTALPLVNQRWSSDFRAESWRPDEYGVGVRHSEISPGAIEALGGRIVDGADLDLVDADTRLVALVNEALADRYFPDRSPVGEKLCFDRLPEDCRNWFEIVGVVGDIRHATLVDEVTPRIFAMVHQDWSRGLFLIARADGSPEPLVAGIRALVGELDPAMPINAVHMLEEVVDEAAARERLVLDLLSAFAVTGVLLAALGTYAVVSYGASARTREIGIRMTLGARRRQVLRSVLSRGLLPVWIGVPAGLVLAVAAGRSLESMLFGVPPVDPVTYAAVSLVLIAVATAACYLPARRATSVDPVVALRD